MDAILLAVFLLVCAAAVKAPADAAASQNDVERVLIEWNFDEEGDLEGWQPNGYLKDVKVKGGILTCMASGVDPILELRTLIEIEASPWQAIEMRMLATKDGIAEFFWSNTTQTKYGGFSPEKRTQFRVRGDGRWHVYRIMPFWHPEGRIIRLRFDPYDGASFAIDYIRIVQLKVPPKVEHARFQFIDSDCGWRAIGGMDLSIGGDGMRIGVSDAQGYLLSPPLSLEAEKQGYISLRMSADRGEAANIMFVTENLHGLQRIAFPINADGEEHTYSLDMLASPRWQGRIIAIALQLSDSAGARCMLRWLSVADKPVGEPHLAIRSFSIEDPMPRAGMVATLTAVIANRGGEPANDLHASLELPEGVRVVGDDDVGVPKLAYGDSVTWRWKVTADKPLSGVATLHVWAANAKPVFRSTRLSFTQRLKLPKAGYVPPPKPVRGKYEVGVYYFPGWKTASQWMPILDYPERKPVLGWYREGDPEVADWHIKWAVEHGITFFVYDWYWVKGARQLEHALHDGYFKARYKNLLKFCLLWANHNPPKSSSLEDCIAVTRFWIEHYFRRPEYLTIDGKPVVIIFSMGRLSEDLGTNEDVRAAFNAMREECVKAGLRGLYIIACVDGAGSAIAASLQGYDAVTAYNWPALGMDPSTGRAPFDGLVDAYRRNWEDIAARSPIPLLLPISGGWDSRPWHGEGALVRYGRTPENFKRHLQDARHMLDDERFKGKLLPMVLIEAWNEWGEGSYIEPHAEFGFYYLDAIRDVFTEARKEHIDLTPSDVGLGPYDVPLSDLYKTAWDFERDEEGWGNTMGMTDVRAADGMLRALTTTDDPAFFGPPVHIRAEDFPFVHIRMRLRREGVEAFKDTGQLFWRTTTLPESESTSVRFEVVGDGEWHEYVLPVHENIRWRGIVTRLRLDPCAQPGVRVDVDFIFLSIRRKFPFFSPSSHPVQIIAHRGMKQLAPENTRPAIEKAMEFGIEWVELDIRLTKDGHHVILHDSRLDRVTNGKGLVKERTLAEILALDAGSWFSPKYAGERILMLKEALEFCLGKINIYLDCKQIEPAQLVDEIFQAKMEKQVVVYGDVDLLKEIKKLSQGRIAVMAKWRPDFDPKDWIDSVNPDAVEIDAPFVTRSVCEFFHRHGIWVEAKTLGDWDKPEVWVKVADAGADWMQTGFPLELANALKDWREADSRLRKAEGELRIRIPLWATQPSLLTDFRFCAIVIPWKGVRSQP
jgi:glycerophosphoryl diester phosphodiesterase